ncbi:MAG: hypothetical protein ACYS0I_17330 [Planctomycetota bacterium]
MKGFVYISFVVCVVMAGVCVGAPEPAIVPGAGIWTVETRFEHPQQIVVRPHGSGSPERFWYMIVTVTNRTKQDVDFYPKCELMTDTFEIIPAGKSVQKTVFEHIKRRYERTYPFLESLEQTSNKILQGEDNTKDIAIIWPDFDAKAKNIKLFIAGLSNETVVIKHPVAKDETGEPVSVFLRKTLELNYALGGDPALRSEVKVSYKGKRWVMR